MTLGPLASIKQYKRVQEYIKSGIEEGAELVIGGEGHPSGLEDGNFVKPTVFANVTRDMRIAKEEIFGPLVGDVVLAARVTQTWPSPAATRSTSVRGFTLRAPRRPNP